MTAVLQRLLANMHAVSCSNCTPPTVFAVAAGAPVAGGTVADADVACCMAWARGPRLPWDAQAACALVQVALFVHYQNHLALFLGGKRGGKRGRTPSS